MSTSDIYKVVAKIELGIYSVQNGQGIQYKFAELHVGRKCTVNSIASD